MNKILKYLIIIAAGSFVLYNSVYFKPLDEIKAEAAAKIFDPKAYSIDFWENKLIPNLNQAVGLNTLLDQLNRNPEEAFKNHSNALGIGNIRFFLVQETARASEINEDHVILALENDQFANLATDYIFGNAIRDASGQIDINEFTNTVDEEGGVRMTGPSPEPGECHMAAWFVVQKVSEEQAPDILPGAVEIMP